MREILNSWVNAEPHSMCLVAPMNKIVDLVPMATKVQVGNEFEDMSSLTLRTRVEIRNRVRKLPVSRETIQNVCERL